MKAKIGNIEIEGTPEEIKVLIDGLELETNTQESKPKTFIGHVIRCSDAEFHGIECIDNGEQYGFEGVYNNDIHHPDFRPAHRIWIKKIEAEKLFRLFFKRFSELIRMKGYDFVYDFDEFIKTGESQ